MTIDTINKIIDSIFKAAVIFLRVLNLIEE
jgi:hypothetical protein